MPVKAVGPRHIFCVISGSVLAFSCSPTTQRSLLSALRISALSRASRFPACTISQIIRIAVSCGTGRRYVTFKLRLTPPSEKWPGRETPTRMVVERLSISVAAHPPCRLPMRLQRSEDTFRR